MKVEELLTEGVLDALRHDIGGRLTSKMDIVELGKRAARMPPSFQAEVRHILELMKKCRTFKEYQQLDMLKKKLEQQLRSNQL